jgi:hypothetical protein
MRQAEDIVWAAITASARRRFDYAEFKSRLNLLDDERMADFILFQMIEGFAEELKHEELLQQVLGDLERFGAAISMDNLSNALADTQAILTAEIQATRLALSGFSKGQTAPEILEQIRRQLAS